jgi:hypothetical protein
MKVPGAASFDRVRKAGVKNDARVEGQLYAWAAQKQSGAKGGKEGSNLWWSHGVKNGKAMRTSE